MKYLILINSSRPEITDEKLVIIDEIGAIADMLEGADIPAAQIRAIASIEQIPGRPPEFDLYTYYIKEN